MEVKPKQNVVTLRRRRESVTALEVLAWIQKQTIWCGTNTITDINAALDAICGSEQEPPK